MISRFDGGLRRPPHRCSLTYVGERKLRRSLPPGIRRAEGAMPREAAAR